MMSILRTSPTGAWIEFENGRWFVATGRGSFPLEEPPGFMGVLPLLERPYSEIHQALKEALANRGISPDLAGSFPASALVIYALRTGSAYWKEQAFRWLEELPVSTELIEPLESICNSRSLPQKLRKKARQLRERLRQRADQEEASLIPPARGVGTPASTSWRRRPRR